MKSAKIIWVVRKEEKINATQEERQKTLTECSVQFVALSTVFRVDRDMKTAIFKHGYRIQVFLTIPLTSQVQRALLMSSSRFWDRLSICTGTNWLYSIFYRASWSQALHAAHGADLIAPAITGFGAVFLVLCNPSAANGGKWENERAWRL